ncbi:hypothetical protein IPL44_01375 [Candidatus Saccharibacteria bacterium]|nr:MAG: hypothetical protein IPL44_01375 [Candidatus Saccharibacteria bacterium]
MKVQKTAIVCDWLTEIGGGEKVILAVHEMFPGGPYLYVAVSAKARHVV